jgi:hypothetical protein
MKVKLSPPERAALRKQGFAASKLAGADAHELAALCALPLERCRYLVAIADFQTLASVGPAAAQDLWDLGCRSLADVGKGDPVAMYHELSRQVGVALDPCVEDVFRCAIAQVRHPDLPLEQTNWWHWKPMRGEAME